MEAVLAFQGRPCSRITQLSHLLLRSYLRPSESAFQTIATHRLIDISADGDGHAEKQNRNHSGVRFADFVLRHNAPPLSSSRRISLGSSSLGMQTKLRQE